MSPMCFGEGAQCFQTSLTRCHSGFWFHWAKIRRGSPYG
jgi:hypothetical protein